jgi:DNA-binding beta-propeller fold protein YncE
MMNGRRELLAALALGVLLAVAPADAQLPAGTLVVTNKTPGTASIIDIASNRILATLPTGQGPHEVAISRDGRTAVVTDYGGSGAGGNSLTVIDVPGRRVIRTIDLGQYRRPHGIAFLPGDSLVAVTSEQSRNVVIVHPGSGQIRRAIATDANGSHMLTFGARADRIYTGNIGSNSVSELDVATGTVRRTFQVPQQPEAIGMPADAREVWVGSNAEGKVSVIDLTSGAVRTAAEGVSWPYRILFTPDDRSVVIPDLRNHHLRILERDTHRELARLDLAGAGPQGVALTPDGRFLFLSLSTQARVAVIDLTTRAIVGYLDAGGTPDGVAYTRP